MEKQCPYCGETIKLGAVKCRYCHTMLNQPAPVVHQEVGALERTATTLNRFGTVAIWLLTVPIVAGVIWGLYGFVIALVVGLCMVGNAVQKWK